MEALNDVFLKRKLKKKDHKINTENLQINDPNH